MECKGTQICANLLTNNRKIIFFYASTPSPPPDSPSISLYLPLSPSIIQRL